MRAVEANADGLVGPTHSYAGLAPGNLASERNVGQVSNPRSAVIEGLAKMRRLHDWGVPQFVLPPHERPLIPFLRGLGFGGGDGEVLERAWKEQPALAAAACSASSMWAANAATVTPSADSADGRVHFTPANLLTNLHRSLEAPQTARSLRALFPDERHFAVHEPLHSRPHFADEGAANHVRLAADHGEAGINLFVFGRGAWEAWSGRFPARQTREAFEAIARRHGARGAVFARQSQAAIDAGAFHNDVVCVGTRETLFFHELAFEDRAQMESDVLAAAHGFEPQFVEISAADLPIEDAIKSYLFNSQLLSIPGDDRLTLLAPVETRENPRAHAAAGAVAASNGPIGRVEYVNVRQSMRNGGGPACLRLRVVLTDEELAAANQGQRFTPQLQERLNDWASRRYRERLTPTDLADPQLLEESRTALDELTQILKLGGDFYPFQRG
ncbi:MAG TPA: N-succinylarginine dihydrolase [Caulobacteraceae bacterium]|nr:N-succinylarginine dihydrolase [Caulobacteraceae bacterium]